MRSRRTEEGVYKVRSRRTEEDVGRSEGQEEDREVRGRRRTTGAQFSWGSPLVQQSHLLYQKSHWCPYPKV